jgi:YVTN family beta-propeller protein
LDLHGFGGGLDKGGGVNDARDQMSERIRQVALIALGVAAALGALASPALARNAYVANSFPATSVTVIDTNTNAAVGGSIPVGLRPEEIAITPDGSRAYVTNSDSDSVSVINTQTSTAIGSIPLAVGAGPVGIAITPDGSRVYVANDGLDSVSVINTQTNAVVGSIPVPAGATWIALTPDGSRAYVANALIAGGFVSVINTQTNTVVGSTIPVGLSPSGIAITPDGGRAYVANETSNSVSVINTQTNSVVGSVPGISFPQAIAITPDGSRAYVASVGGANTVSVIDTRTNTTLGIPIPVGDTPRGVAVIPDGSRVYVANGGSSSLSIINTPTNAVIGSVPAGTAPFGIAITPDQPPKASLKTQAKGLNVTLKGGGSSDPDGKVGTYSFGFGDGRSAQTTAPTAKHTYRKVGEFKVSLTVSDNEGCSTSFVFTGQTASCNGPSTASVTRTVATVKLGKLKRNTRNGSAILAIKVPGKGTLKLSSKGVAKQRPGARASSLAKAIKHKGTVKLRIKAKGKAKRRLDLRGKAKVKIKVTFKPKSGDPNTQTKRVRLVERP